MDYWTGPGAQAQGLPQREAKTTTRRHKNTRKRHDAITKRHKMNTKSQKTNTSRCKRKRCWCPYSLPFSSSCTYIKSVRRPPPWRNINTPMWVDKRQTHARLLMLGYYAMSFQGQMSSRPMCHGIVGIHLLLCHPEKWTKKAFKGAFNPKRLAIGIHKSLFFCRG